MAENTNKKSTSKTKEVIDEKVTEKKVDSKEKENKSIFPEQSNLNAFPYTDKMYAPEYDGKYHISNMSIIELNAYVEACLNILNYYDGQFQMSKSEADAKDRMKYFNYFVKLKDEIIKRFEKLCD